MDNRIREALISCETDIDGAIYRFSGNEELYLQCLITFLDDTTLNELETAIKSEMWDEAFTSAHAIKGLAGNMGFVPLFHSAANMVVLIRNGKINDLPGVYKEFESIYNNVKKIIKENCLIEKDIK